MKNITVEQAIRILHNGEFIFLTSDDSDVSENALVCSATKITSSLLQKMNLFAKGEIFVAMEEILFSSHEFKNRDTCSNFSVNLATDKKGVSTQDKIHTILLTINALTDPAKKGSKFTVPGHVYPYCTKKGGVLVRIAPQEGIVDLCRIGGLAPIGVLFTITKQSDQSAEL